jgi:hypothetical protein
MDAPVGPEQHRVRGDGQHFCRVADCAAVRASGAQDGRDHRHRPVEQAHRRRGRVLRRVRAHVQVADVLAGPAGQPQCHPAPVPLRQQEPACRGRPRVVELAHVTPASQWPLRVVADDPVPGIGAVEVPRHEVRDEFGRIAAPDAGDGVAPRHRVPPRQDRGRSAADRGEQIKDPRALIGPVPRVGGDLGELKSDVVHPASRAPARRKPYR